MMGRVDPIATQATRVPVVGLAPFALVSASAGRGHAHKLRMTPPRSAWRGVRPIDGRIRGGRTIYRPFGPGALRAHR
jgi:hypothetical protein